MGTIRKGILGGFSGKVGTVIGANWKGGTYMRSLPQKGKKSDSLAQRSQRTKFAITINLLQPLTSLLRVGWKLYAHNRSAINAAMAYTIANAVTGNYPDYQIDPGKVLVSRGALTPATNAMAAFSTGKIDIVWDDNSGYDSAKATDKTLIAILNFDKRTAITQSDGVERFTGVQNIAIPVEWAGDEVHTYMGFISEDGKEVANSLYLGKIKLV
jgi:hypothetical protein